MVDTTYGDQGLELLYHHESDRGTIFCKELHKQVRMIFQGRITTVARPGCIHIGTHRGVKLYMDFEEAVNGSKMIVPAWWASIVDDPAVATMICERKVIGITYRWRESILQPEKGEHITVDIPVLVPKPDCIGKPCIISRVLESFDVQLEKGTKSKGKGKGKSLSSSDGDTNHEKRKAADSHWQPSKAARHLA